MFGFLDVDEVVRAGAFGRRNAAQLDSAIAF
jgi:hypothetical protein